MVLIVKILFELSIFTLNSLKLISLLYLYNFNFILNKQK